MKFFVFGLIILSIFLSAGCGSTAESNTTANAANNSNANKLVKVDANNLPPGLSASPITPISNTGNVNGTNSMTKGTTPTPGIPDPKTLGKPMKPGATPTPGIPDPETIRRQMQMQRGSNANIPPPPPGNGSMMKTTKKRNISNTNNR